MPSSIDTIYLARHGFRLSWESTIWTSPTGTPRDPPLSAHGEDQSKELATWLAGLPDRPEAIYSSPLYRCLQTATPTATALSLPIQIEHGISEFYLPVRRGLHPRALPASALQKWFPLVDPGAHESVLYPSQKGETIEGVHDRAEEVLRLLLGKHEAGSGGGGGEPVPVQRILLFTHAATNIALARALMNDRDMPVRSGTCSIGKYVRVPGSEEERDGLGRWERVLDGETGFLEKGEERHWEFSYVEEYEEDGILEGATEEVPLASEHYGHNKAEVLPVGKL